MKGRNVRGGAAPLVLALALVVALLACFGYAPPARADASPEAEGQTPAVEALTLRQAVEMALAASRELRQAERDVEAARIKRDETWDYYNAVLLATYDPQTGLYVSKPNMPDPTPAVYQTDYAWRRAKKNLEVKKDTVVRRVYEQYYAVLQAASAVEVARLELESLSLSLKAAEARRAVGMETALAVADLRFRKAQAEAAMQAAESKLEQAWSGLNLLLGKPASWRAELSDRPSYAPLEVADLEAEVARLVEESPGVWEANAALQLQRNTYGMTNSYDYDRVALAKAYENVAIAREQTEQAVRNLYRGVKSLEASYAAAEASLASAREALRVRELMYQVGAATQAEVAAARAALAKAEDGLLALTAQHELAKMAFFKPWAASGSSASAAVSAQATP